MALRELCLFLFRHWSGVHREAGFLKDGGKRSQVTLTKLVKSGIDCSHILHFSQEVCVSSLIVSSDEFSISFLISLLC